MSPYEVQQTLISLQKKRQAALLHNRVRQVALERQGQLYASKGQAKEYYATMARLREDEDRIKDDLEQYEVMMAN